MAPLETTCGPLMASDLKMLNDGRNPDAMNFKSDTMSGPEVVSNVAMCACISQIKLKKERESKCGPNVGTFAEEPKC